MARWPSRVGVVAGALILVAGAGVAQVRRAPSPPDRLRGTAEAIRPSHHLEEVPAPVPESGTPPTAWGAETRTIDGSGNNVAQPVWGSAGVQLLRKAPASYADGISSPARAAAAGARVISNGVCIQSSPTANQRGATDMLWQWGQFLDHDLDLTHLADPAEPFDIPVPAGDPHFDPGATGTASIALDRSAHDPASGTGPASPRQQTNAITAYIDASNVYGSDASRAAALRTGTGGRLATSSGDLLPFNTGGLPNAGGPSASLFLAGDVRANEQVGLTALHTLFLREHNRLAAEIAVSDPGLDDEELYQRARALVGAQMQVITYNEFLPVLLGPGALSPYQGYDAAVDAGIANAFATAAYRVGHTMLSPSLLRLGPDGAVIPEGHLALRDAFFAPHRITGEGGIEPLLRGLTAQRMQEVDTFVVDDVRNFLFGDPGSGGFDLASLNIQRGRDHGIASYNDLRAAYGLPAATTFADITSSPALQAALQSAYGGLADVDPWVGGLAEDHVTGAMVGELFRAVLVEQFERLRDGDRFWYENRFSGATLQELEGTTLVDVIRRNTTIGEEISDAAFAVSSSAADSIPTLSGWALGLLAALVLGAGCLVLWRRSPRAA